MKINNKKIPLTYTKLDDIYSVHFGTVHIGDIFELKGKWYCSNDMNIFDTDIVADGKKELDKEIREAIGSWLLTTVEELLTFED